MPAYPQFASDDPRDSCRDDADALTVVNNNDHPVKLFTSDGRPAGALQPGHWFRFPASRLFRGLDSGPKVREFKWPHV